MLPQLIQQRLADVLHLARLYFMASNSPSQGVLQNTAFGMQQAFHTEPVGWLR